MMILRAWCKAHAAAWPPLFGLFAAPVIAGGSFYIRIAPVLAAVLISASSISHIPSSAYRDQVYFTENKQNNPGVPNW
jgi:hypothetical protein